MFSWLIRLFVVNFALCYAVAVSENNPKTCPRFHIKAVRKRTIVLAHDSIEHGAKYLGQVEAKTYRSCYDECCNKDTCNMVNIKIKMEYSQFSGKMENRVHCYMFNCGSPSKCLFRSGSEDSIDSLKDSAVLELENRDKEKPVFSWNSKEKPTPTTAVPKPTSTQARLQEDHWQNLWSANKEKEQTDDLHDIKPTTPSPQNPFNSEDVHHWGSQTHSLGNSNTRQETNKHPKQKPTKYHHKITPTTTKATVVTWQTKKEEDKKDYDGYDGSKYSFDRDHDATDHRQDEVDEPTTEPEEDFPRRVFVDNNPDYPELPKSHRKTPRSTNPPSTEEKTDKPLTKEGDMEVSTKPVTTKTETSGGFNNVVIKRFSIQENKAVIPLAVGLVLSLLLLMAVIFRLKTGRRRRTKAFLTDDADYLINGMYL